MPLTSKAFRGDSKLEACLVSDPAHLTQGTVGQHVAKVQRALLVLDNATISPTELCKHLYGPTTAAAVLDYKTARQIINHTYQSKPDNIVGKMTIAALDREMAALERQLTASNACAGKRSRA